MPAPCGHKVVLPVTRQVCRPRAGNVDISVPYIFSGRALDVR